MKWASSIESTEGTPSGPSMELNWAQCVEKLIQSLKDELEGNPDLLILFVSPDHKNNFEKIVEQIRAALNPKAFIGCTAGGLIGGGREVEQQSAIALTGAVLPGVRVNAFHVAGNHIPDLDDPPQSWEKLVQVENKEEPSFILLTDPFGFKLDSFVQGLDYAFARSVKLGGLASGGHKAGENRLLCQDQVYRSGVVGVSLCGNIQVDPVVAQGCRAIGKTSRVTKCDKNLLYELDGKPAVLVLKEAIERLPERDQKLAKEAIFLGVAMDEFQEKFVSGDFLVRNIYGIEPMSGALLVGEALRPERTVQFHLRDAESSADDLRSMLRRYIENGDGRPSSGALLFSCMGRGFSLYGRTNHDSDCLREYLGEVPIGGFFCNGEIGPVGDSTFLHGYTSSFGIFKEKY
jgi:small ligand-binding sensory domain FIST